MSLQFSSDLKKPFYLERAEGPLFTVGGAALDIYIQCPIWSLEQDVKSYLVFEEGVKVDVTNLRYSVGGGAANTAYVLARLGMPVSTFFKTGMDYAADFIRQNLVQKGIDISHAVSDRDVFTGTSFILPSSSGNHTILVCRGSNAQVRECDLPLDEFKKSKGVYIAPLAGNFMSHLPLISEAVHEAGGLVMHNPSRAGVTELSGLLFRSIRFIDVLMLNYSEVEELSVNFRKKRKGFWLKHVCERIASSGPRVVLVTDGAKGVYCFSEKRLWYYRGVPESGSRPVCRTVGAGDAFGATFFGALLMGKSVHEALVFASINSLATISQLEPHGGLFTMHELNDQMKALDESARQVVEI
ncbi:TPA: hypothetical protein DDZ86_00770 [Candidatus Dependentiae bacterium]|nr:MAG: PfkB domain protein [candidate division TM6 bacterium GW2011_GWF2_43_87]HBL98157.1 hypothetical protein [Candidatus Dependentiae bacterium]